MCDFAKEYWDMRVSPEIPTDKYYDKALLEKAKFHLLMDKFGGPSEPEISWIKRVFYFFFPSKRPVPVYTLPKNTGSKIKFRRYGKFPVQTNLSENDGELPYTEKDLHEWENRFVIFGFILIQALKQIAQSKSPEDATLATRALVKFNEKTIRKHRVDNDTDQKAEPLC